MTKECEDCGDDIPKKRLEVVPDTTLCVACQEQNDVFRVRAIVAQNEEGDNEIAGFVKSKDSWEKLNSYKKDPDDER